ncbi:MAG TPA: class I SAM-dependent methyltransferase [Gaiellaceae bacterium]|nr:class I SAM-dependent methyltransferase [Gaiellaceae bacterium]
MNIQAMIRRAPKTVRNAVADLRYGGLLGGTTRTKYAELGAFDTANSDYADLPALFAAADVKPGDVLVDVGCGKGRALNWLVGHYGANEIVGIEIDPEICARTARRLRRFKRVQIVCGDAIALLPAEGTVFYLFNPFDERTMQRFADALLELGDTGSTRRVIYYNSKFLDPFRQDPRFGISEIELPSRSHRSALITLAPSGQAPAGDPSGADAP